MSGVIDVKLAFLAPTQKWSIHYKFMEYKKFIEKYSDNTVDVFLGREIPATHAKYDWVIGAVKYQRTYETDIFKHVRDRFIGLVTGYECRNRVENWSLFQHLWFWADCYIDERFKDNAYIIEQFGVDHTLFKPMEIEKKHFACFVGNDKWPKKRIDTFFKPLCAKAGVNHRIINGLTEWVPQKELPRAYNECSCYLNTSIYEAGPAPVLEAASCGIPIISCNSGFSAMFKRDAVILCDSWNDYLEALDILKTDEHKRVRMGHEARKEILENWTWEKRTKSLLKKLENLS